MKRNSPSSQTLRSLPPSEWGHYAEEDTIDLLELGSTLMSYKWMILGMLVFTVVSTSIIVDFLPKQYQASITFLQISGASNTPINTGKMGMLASLAGVELPASSSDSLTSKIDVVLKSRMFSEKLIQQMKLLAIIYKQDYVLETNTYNFLNQPTALDAAARVTGAISLNSTPEGAREILIRWDDPLVATELANQSLKSLENYLSQNTLTSSQKNLKLVKNQLILSEQQLRKAEKGLRNFNLEKRFFIYSSQTKITAETLGKLQIQKATSEIEKEMLLQFRNKNSPQLQQINLQNKALDKQIKQLSNRLLQQSEKLGNLKLEQEFLMKELEVYQAIYKQLRLSFEQGKADVTKETILFKVIDSALVSTASSSISKKKLIVTLSAVLSLFLGIILVFLIEFIRKINQIPEETSLQTSSESQQRDYFLKPPL